MHGTIAAASCLSCHIFSTRSCRELGGQSGWQALIDTHLNFNSEILAQQKGSAVWHFCLFISLKSPLQQSCSSLLLLLPDHVIQARHHHHFHQGRYWSHVFPKKFLVFYGSCLFINLWYWEVPAESVMCVTTYSCNLQNDCIHRNYLFLSSYTDLHLWFQASPLWNMLVNSVYSSPGFWILPHSLSIHIFSGLGWTEIPLSAVTDTVLLRKVAFELKLQYTRTDCCLEPSSVPRKNCCLVNSVALHAAE